MKTLRILIGMPMCAVVLMLGACVEEPPLNAAANAEPDNDSAMNDATSVNTSASNQPAQTDNVTDIAEFVLQDDQAVYQADGYGTVNVIRMLVRTEIEEGPCEVDNYVGCTLDDIISDIDRNDDFKPNIQVHFTADDYPDDGSISNAVLTQRGGSTRLAEQKSFKIRINDRDSLWRGERTILLNKHPYESTRIRNKLAFDLMRNIPNLMSNRSQFVNLWIDNGAGAEDYGLFTHIEAPGGNYLERRGLDRDDRLYKINLFRFDKEDLAKIQVDGMGQPLDLKRFESSLDIEAGEDHRPLAAMLEAMEDPDRSFASTLDQYFDADNVLTWMSANLLLHQTDAVSQNFILYNPLGTERFYFLPWDYDGGFVKEVEPSIDGTSNSDLQKRAFYGYARGSNSNFYRDYYRLPGIHQKLLDKATKLHNTFLTTSFADELAREYESVVEPWVTRSPDIDHNPNYNAFTVQGLAGTMNSNLEALRTRFSMPVPPELEDPELDNDEWVFRWEPAIELTGSDIRYDLLIANDTSFSTDSIVFQRSQIEDESEEIEVRVDAAQIPSGQHFVRVISRASRDPDRFWQVPHNKYRDDGNTYFGMEAFDVP